MIEIPLTQIPNQSFSLQLDTSFYNITIKFVINLMTVSIVRDGEVIIENVRAEPNQGIIPYDYLQDGNFAFLTVDNEYPIYTSFGVDQFFIYATQDEIEVLRETI